jgi:TolA-binding protein
MEQPQHLLERGRFELAVLYRDAGRLDEARDLLDRIVADHPDGRRAPQALELLGRIADEVGEPTRAREFWERLLAQYPDYLFIDDVRDALRNLP